MNASKPNPIFPSAAQVPAELLLLSWLGFQYKWNGHKYAKPPHSPVDGSRIGPVAKNASHFLSFADAVVGAAKHKLDGIGLVFRDEGLVGIDFDNCRDAESGVINPEVLNWLRWFRATYAEISVSGTGIHAICKGRIPEALTSTPLPNADGVNVEIYNNERYFTFTAQLVEGHPLEIADCQDSINKLLGVVGGKKAKKAEKPKEQEKPLPRSLIQKMYRDMLNQLLHARQGEGNSLLNSTAFFAARAYRSGALEQATEEEIKAELLRIVTKEWKSPHEENGARGTIDSGWGSGMEAEPFNVTNKMAVRYLPGDLETALPACESILQAIGLKYFERNRELVHTVYGRDLKDGDCGRAEESVIIVPASHHTLVTDLDKLSQFWVPNEKGEPAAKHVPAAIPGHLHNRVETKPREVPFPSLDVVTSSPVLLPSGCISQEMFAEGVLFVPRDRNLYAPVPECPTREDAIKAMSRFDDIFLGFPFVDTDRETVEWQKTSSYAVALSIPLTLVARPMLGIGAFVPLTTANAPTPRYGKTKIIKSGVAAALGYEPTTVQFSDEEEFGKHLLPLMRAGDRAILIDNVERTLQSTKLNILITENVLRDRVLGESRDVKLSNYAAFFATGNNLTIGGDLATRALRCDIDAKLERPEARAFNFDPVQRAKEHHPVLVVAACTALRAYLLAGKPWSLSRAPWGGFKRWDELITGCLTWLGYADPYLSRDRVLTDDPIRETNASILEEWYREYGDREIGLRTIRNDKNAVTEALETKNGWDGHHAQWILRRLENKVIDGLRLVKLAGRSRFVVQKLKDRQESLQLGDSSPEPPF